MVEQLPVSIVIPVRNEEDNVAILCEEISAVMKEKIDLCYEIIFVNDHSTDNTLAVLNKCRVSNSRVKVCSINEEMGKDWALNAGFCSSVGDIVITMDGDLQNDPHDIPLLLDKIGRFDMVCGVRSRRKDALITRLFSKIANGFRNAVTRDSIADAGCGIRAMKRHCAGILCTHTARLYGHAHCFYPALLRMHGFKVAQVAVSHRPRIHGKSKYRPIRGRLVSGIQACLVVRKMKREFANEMVLPIFH
jgi:glycosyltransferase involved in cell wall biosynthesis